MSRPRAGFRLAPRLLPCALSRRDFLALAGSPWGLASGLGLVGCGAVACPNPRPTGVWNNAVCSMPDLKPAQLVSPSTASAVIALVQAAEAKKTRIRMTGTGHSFSDVALTDDTLLLPDQLAEPLTLERSRLKPEAAADHRLVRVQAGMPLRKLNAWLWGQGLSLENMGGYDAQTIAGVAMTATHGSGLAYGPIASQIASLQLVTAGGRLLQVEPKAGITDPAKFKPMLEEEPNVPLELRQDDELFRAVSVSMGCMGIVTALVLKAVPAFWLRETRTLHRWSDLARKGGYLEGLIERPRDPAYPDHVEVSVNPYKSALENDHLCILTQRHRLAKPPKPTLESGTRGLVGNGELFADPRLRSLTEGGLRDQLDQASPAGLETILTSFLFALYDQNYTAESYKVFNVGGINSLRAFGIEMAFPLADTIPATEALFAKASEELVANRHHSVPVSLRFVKQSDALLAMQAGRDTTMMEIGMLVEAKGAATLLRNYETYFMQRFNARPHWGLDLSILNSWAQVESLYGAANAASWHHAYDELNKSGVFKGRLTDRLKI
jgi:hypothetical protein